MGHWLASKTGAYWRTIYILAMRDLSLSEFFRILADVSGKPAPKMRIPYSVALMAAHVVGICYGRLTGHENPKLHWMEYGWQLFNMQYNSQKGSGTLRISSNPHSVRPSVKPSNGLGKNSYTNS